MVTFQSQQFLEVPQISGLLSRLAEHYQIQIPRNLNQPSSIEIQLLWPTSPEEIWRKAPVHTSAAYLRFATRLSVALQQTLRLWLPYLWFSDAEKFGDFETTATLMTYAASRPFTAKNKQCYTFDVLDGDTPRAILYSVRRNIIEIMTPLHEMLTQLQSPFASQYAPRRWEKVIAVYQKKTHPLNSILFAEKEIVEEYIRRPIIFESAEKTAKSDLILNRRLRKLFSGKDFTSLGPLLEIEALRAASDALDSGQELSAKIFANSREFSPLSSYDQNLLFPDCSRAAEPQLPESCPVPDSRKDCSPERCLR